MNFSSENFDAVHPQIISALLKANKGFAPSYGKDEYTQKATATIRKILASKELEVFFCFNGTGANNFALSSITEKHNSIFCSDVSHIFTAESTAPETFTGCRLYPIQSINGKIVKEDFLLQLKRTNDLHRPTPAVLTITQPTEYGTIYNLNELKEIAKICKEHHILLHVDGARIFNALAAMKCSFVEFIKVSGADVLTVGGTKSGLMFGEAVLFLKSKRFKDIKYNHKRSMQLASKNRYIAVQFYELLQNELWKKIANYSNELAQYFRDELIKIDSSVIAYSVETNTVFMKMKLKTFEKLKASANFYMWDKRKEEARFVFSFGNTKMEIDRFFKFYKNAVREK